MSPPLAFSSGCAARDRRMALFRLMSMTAEGPSFHSSPGRATPDTIHQNIKRGQFAEACLDRCLVLHVQPLERQPVGRMCLRLLQAAGRSCRWR